MYINIIQYFCALNEYPMVRIPVWKVLILLLFANISFAQRGWEAGGGLGLTYYFGDLNTQFRFDKPGPQVNLAARFNFNERLSWKFAVSYGYIYASDSTSPNAFERARNLSFRSHLGELSGQFEFNFLPYNHLNRYDNWTPYMFLGFSTFYFNPQAKLDDNYISLRSLGTEGQFKGEEYYTIQPSLVYGAGVKADFNEYWSINIEISLRRLFTDYLDDVSKEYPDKEDLLGLRGPTALLLSNRALPENSLRYRFGEPGRQRGNSKDNDSFNFVSVSALYYFGSVKCPKM